MRTLLTTLFIMAAWSIPAQAQVFEVYSGEETYFRFCASCHGESAEGDGPVAANLSILVPDLTRLRQRQGTKLNEDTLRRIIDGRDVVVSHGTRIMPVWGFEFWVEEGADDAAEKSVKTIIQNLIDYLMSIQIEQE